MNAFQTQFDAALTEWMQAKRAQYTSTYAHIPSFFNLFDATEAIILSGGKRLRPYLASLLYEATHGAPMIDLRPLFAIELFHVFGLMHDDIIDQGEHRRGVATVHRNMRERYAAAGAIGDTVHLGESMALLMGDLVFSWCHELFDGADYETDIKKDVKQLFADMSEAVMIGQMLDVDITAATETTSVLIEEKMKLKTASYTFQYPMQIGIALGGGNEELMQFATDFGLHMGLAFQTQDDLLDIIGEESVTKKTPLRDIVEGQHTLLTQHVFDHGTDADIAELLSFLRVEIDSSDIESVRSIFERTGAIAAAQDYIALHTIKGKDILAAAPLNVAIKETFTALICRMESRSS